MVKGEHPITSWLRYVDGVRSNLPQSRKIMPPDLEMLYKMLTENVENYMHIYSVPAKPAAGTEFIVLQPGMHCLPPAAEYAKGKRYIRAYAPGEMTAEVDLTTGEFVPRRAPLQPLFPTKLSVFPSKKENKAEHAIGIRKQGIQLSPEALAGYARCSDYHYFEIGRAHV